MIGLGVGRSGGGWSPDGNVERDLAWRLERADMDVLGVENWGRDVLVGPPTGCLN